LTEAEQVKERQKVEATVMKRRIAKGIDAESVISGLAITPPLTPIPESRPFASLSESKVAERTPDLEPKASELKAIEKTERTGKSLYLKLKVLDKAPEPELEAYEGFLHLEGTTSGNTPEPKQRASKSVPDPSPTPQPSTVQAKRINLQAAIAERMKEMKMKRERRVWSQIGL
jgi:hypothetical protein